MNFLDLSLNDNEWGNLMFGEKAPLTLPPDSLQANWCGTSGKSLAVQTVAFYKLVLRGLLWSLPGRVGAITPTH